MGSAATEREVRNAMASIALGRTRAVMPVLVVGMPVALVVTQPAGMALPPAVVALNAVMIAVALGLWLVLRRDGLEPHGHLLGALVWAIAPINTLGTALITRQPGLAVPLMIEVATASIMTSSRWCLGALAITIAVWIPLAIRAGGSLFGLYLGGVVGTAVVAMVLQVIMRRSLERAEAMRLAQDDEIDAHLRTAERLAAELEERRRAEDERERLRDQFVHAQRMEAVGTMAAGLAHDLNNILTGMLGIVQLMRDDATDDQVRSDCDAVLREGFRGAELTRSLVAFSRRSAIEKRTLVIADTVEELCKVMRRTLPKAVVVQSRHGAAAIVSADTAQLEQVLMNLCLNAADAMPDGGAITIETDAVIAGASDANRLELRAGERYATIVVADTGHGMPPAVQRRVFEPFFTTKPTGKGTGLGLAMVYGAIKGHGGAIDVASTPGQGTRFTIYLPTVEAVPPPAVTHEDSGTFRTGRVVLVVDDEPQVRQTTARLLERLGFQVITADHGAAALEVFAARGDDIALVVLDMAMPVMGGAECFRRLRQRSRVPVLVASGYAVEHEAHELLAAGVTGFLEKPYTAAELSAQITRALT